MSSKRTPEPLSASKCSPRYHSCSVAPLHRCSAYHSCSAAPLPWRCAFSWVAPVFKVGRSLLAIGSNCSSQPTAYGVG
ncbi:MAG: DUF1010 domain-containing protein [Proteobacteria bacterium]|nr:DUF1010 domain-containing protein [Pseudomonadota bacterium]